jgi:hypothetical protein
MKQVISIETSQMTYKSRVINAKIITVSSTFQHNVDIFFENELIKVNTLKIIAPLAKARFVLENTDSPLWQEGFKYELSIRPFGLINIWGIHHIKVLSINQSQKTIITRERNAICKIWEHTLTFKKINGSETVYTDEVILYAGGLTAILAKFLAYSYKKRHQNWDKLLNRMALGEPV